jgi:hypothetical protein
VTEDYHGNPQGVVTAEIRTSPFPEYKSEPLLLEPIVLFWLKWFLLLSSVKDDKNKATDLTKQQAFNDKG